MKKLLALLALVVPVVSYAAEVDYYEEYVQIDPIIQIVITTTPCKMFTAPKEVILLSAYAQNMETGDKAYGCFTLEKDVYQIELVNDEDKKMYSYRIHHSHFKPRPNL